MNDNASQQQKPQQPRTGGERTPIPIARLLITHTNPSGVEIPHGPEGKSVRRVHTIAAGVESDVQTAIEHRPWERIFRITRARRVTRTEKGKEVEDWIPMGRPFRMPDTWAISEPMDE